MGTGSTPEPARVNVRALALTSRHFKDHFSVEFPVPDCGTNPASARWPNWWGSL